MQVTLIICYADRIWTYRNYEVSFDDDERGGTSGLVDRAKEKFWKEYNEDKSSPLVEHIFLDNITCK